MSEGTLKEVLRGEKSWHLICNHVIDGLKSIPDGRFHCAVTSPPYYGLRSYLPKGHEDKDKEIGLEETPAAYISRMVEVFREVRRVLHETGVLWVNLGSSYASGDSCANQSRPVLNAPACGNDDKELEGLTKSDSSCSRPGGERRGGSRSRRVRSARISRPRSEATSSPGRKGRDSEPVGLSEVVADVPSRDARRSTTSSSSDCVPASSSHEDRASASRQVRRTSSSCALPCGCNSVCTCGTVPNACQSSSRTSGTASSAACGDPNCKGSCGICWVYSTIPHLKFKAGDLLPIPWMFAMAMQEDGWILRADVIWTKNSAMPESVTGWRWEQCRVKVSSRKRKNDPYAMPSGGRKDPANPNAVWKPCPGCKKCEPNDGLVLRKGSWRPTRAHEHIFLFAKSDRYYCDGEAVRTKIEEVTKIRDTYSRILQDEDEQFAVQHDHETPSNPAGANLRDWWLLKQQQLDEGHYAAFPPSLPAMCIKAGTSQKGVCKKCGMPWARVVERKNMVIAGNDRRERMGNQGRIQPSGMMVEPNECHTISWRPTCSCNADSISALVLDPFTGSGTSGIVAQKLGRRFVGIDLSEEYIAIARRRIRRRGHGKAPPKDQKKEVGGFF